MKFLNSTLLYLSIFIAGSLTAVFFEDPFHRLVRAMYSALTQHKISFHLPKLDLYFTFISFGISFGLFLSFLVFLLRRQTKRQVQINSVMTVIFLAASLLLYCYFDANMRLIECTACNDGTITLGYSDVNYTRIFITALVASLIPGIWTEMNNRRKSKRQPAIIAGS